jgi:WD40 repeat protein
MSKRLLISAGTSTYHHLAKSQQRPGLQEIITSVTRLFTEELGYTPVLPILSANPSSNILRRELDKWLVSTARDEADWVVFYYTGHGELVGDDALYLLTCDFENGQHASTAFAVNQLADMLIGRDSNGENRRVRRLFLILDTCYSGTGGFEVLGRLRKLFSQGGLGGAFYVLAAAFPNEEALSGALAGALIASLQDRQLGGTQQRHIYFDQLLSAINRRLPGHQAMGLSVLAQGVEPEFFPNPYYIPGLPLAPTVAETRRVVQQFIASPSWSTGTRKLEVEQHLGEYFMGRDRILAELLRWLAGAADAGARLAVVTGRAGAGKSAILSRLVTLCEAPSRSLPLSFAPELSTLPALHLTIHAKGKTLQEVIEHFAQVLQVEAHQPTVLTYLRQLPTAFRIVIDALDEAREPLLLVQELLLPLSACPTIKLLIGTRPEYVAALTGPATVVLNVENNRYLKPQDLVDYVTAQLLNKEDYVANNPFRDQLAQASQVAKILAEKAYPNFLIARLTSESLLALPTAPHPTEVEQMSLPASLKDAFDQYLERFGANQRQVRQVLTALAWSEGQGLPAVGGWAPVASALAQRKYDEDDVAAVLQLAGSFIVESLENDRSVYRLYHQALADYLRADTEELEAQHRIAQALIGSVPPLADGAGPDWRLATAYVRTHLAEHAASSEHLTHLLEDPLYLLCAEPSRLLSVLTRQVHGVAPGLVSLYKSVIHHIREKPLVEAASYLRLHARQRGLSALAEHSSLNDLECQWEVSWVHWRTEAASYAFGKAESAPTCIEAVTWATRSVALIGRTNGTCEVRDLRDGTCLVSWVASTEVGAVRKIQFAESDGNAWLLAVWNSQQLGVFDLAKQQVESIHKLHSPVLAICPAVRESQPVIVTAHEDRRLIVWALPDMHILVERPEATATKVYGLAEVRQGLARQLLLLTDHLRAAGDKHPHPLLQLWSLATLTPEWAEAPRNQGIGFYHESGLFFGQRLSIISMDHWGPAEIWDLEAGHRVFQDDNISTRAWLYQFQDATLLITQQQEHLRVQRLHGTKTGTTLQLTAELLYARIFVTGSTLSSLVPLQGRYVWLNQVNEHVRVWDVEELLAGAMALGNAEGYPLDDIISLCASSHAESTLYAGNTHEIVALDTATGVVRKKWSLPKAKQIRTLAIAPANDALIAGSYNGYIYTLPLAAGIATPQLLTHEASVAALQSVHWMGQNLLFATVQRKQAWAVRLWDTDTGTEISMTDTYGLSWGQEDKPLLGLAVANMEHMLRFAFASKYGQVMVGEYPASPTKSIAPYEIWPIFSPPNQHHSRPYRDNQYVECLAQGTEANRHLLVSGTEKGLLTVWDLYTGQVLACVSQAHQSEISALCFHLVRDHTLIVTGGKDGIIRFWDSRLASLFNIELNSPITALTWPTETHLSVSTKQGLLLLRLHLP